MAPPEAPLEELPEALLTAGVFFGELAFSLLPAFPLFSAGAAGVGALFFGNGLPFATGAPVAFAGAFFAGAFFTGAAGFLATFVTVFFEGFFTADLAGLAGLAGFFCAFFSGRATTFFGAFFRAFLAAFFGDFLGVAMAQKGSPFFEFFRTSRRFHRLNLRCLHVLDIAQHGVA